TEIRTGNALLHKRFAVLSHSMQLERSVDRVTGRRRNTEFLAERAHFACEPVEREAIAALEVVRHRCLHAGLALVDDKIHAIVEVRGIERDTLGLADRKGLFHQCTEESPQIGVRDDRSYR